LSKIACNSGLTERQERRKQNLQTRIKAALERAGLVLNHFESDPRGYAVYLDLPDGSYNSFGGRGTPQFVLRFPAAKQNKTAPTKTRTISGGARRPTGRRAPASNSITTGRSPFALIHHSRYPFP